MRKLFVVKKYVYATSAVQAIKLEKKQKPDDVWVDDDWKKENMYKEPEVGFKSNKKKK